MNPLEALRHPILQAPIGVAASIELAAAVCNAGGMGSLALTWSKPTIAEQEVRRLREHTDKPFAVNFVHAFPLKSLDATLAAGAPVITFSWGVSRAAIERVHNADASAGVQVGSARGALAAMEMGADFLVCQGMEAGGHVQSTTSLARLLPEVVDIAGPTPVVAAGGLADGRDVAWALELGAAAVMLGTRFVATVESTAHPDYKQAILDAGRDATSYTWCFDGGWSYSGHRVLRNRTLERWEAEGCPLPGNRPGEHEIVATTSTNWRIPRYHIAMPVETTTGDVLDLALYAGTGCERISEILPAGEVITTIMDELAATRRSRVIDGEPVRLEEARAALAEEFRIEPDITLERVKRQNANFNPDIDPDFNKREIDGLRKAGLPE
jgi:NAD(P)H-dependent flavin oxidoreductase YrpB (nitropropane dioxygenase family)